MKNRISKILIVISFGFLFYSCGEDFLDLSPYSNYTISNYFEEEEHILAAVNGLYPVLRGHYQGAVWKFEEFRSDNTTFQYNPADRGRQDFESIDYFEMYATNGDINGLWGNSYIGIARANLILESIEGIDFVDEKVKLAKEGEARFMRAFMYYQLVKFFGDVPMVDRTINNEELALTFDRVPVQDIITNIVVPDLTFAIENLPEKTEDIERGRAGKAAAQVLLARVYFLQKDYESALPIINNIVESGEYSIENNFRDVFDPAKENSNKEVILAAQYSIAAQQGNGFISSWLPNNSGTEITGDYFVNSLQGRNIPTKDLIRNFEAKDKRFGASIRYYIKENDTVPYINKFLFPPITNSGSDADIPIFRYAEVLLMQAEALVKKDGGLPDLCFENLNLLRSRAGLPLLYPGNPVPELNIDSEEKLIEAIKKERRVELAFEGVRYSDLIRYGELQTVMKAHGEEMKLSQGFLVDYPMSYTNVTELLGLPSEQVKLYGYDQNEGW